MDAEVALNSDSGYGTLDETTGKPLVYYLRTAEEALASYQLTVRNLGGHTRAPRRDNAIYDLAAALGRIQSYDVPIRWNDTTLTSCSAWQGQRQRSRCEESLIRATRHRCATMSRMPYVGVVRDRSAN